MTMFPNTGKSGTSIYRHVPHLRVRADVTYDLSCIPRRSLRELLNQKPNNYHIIHLQLERDNYRSEHKHEQRRD